MIVRIDPETSLIDTDRRTEYRAMEAAYNGRPARPRAALPGGGRQLDRPAFLGHLRGDAAARPRPAAFRRRTARRSAVRNGACSARSRRSIRPRLALAR